MVGDIGAVEIPKGQQLPLKNKETPLVAFSAQRIIKTASILTANRKAWNNIPMQFREDEFDRKYRESTGQFKKGGYGKEDFTFSSRYTATVDKETQTVFAVIETTSPQDLGTKSYIINWMELTPQGDGSTRAGFFAYSLDKDGSIISGETEIGITIIPKESVVIEQSKWHEGRNISNALPVLYSKSKYMQTSDEDIEELTTRFQRSTINVDEDLSQRMLTYATLSDAEMETAQKFVNTIGTDDSPTVQNAKGAYREAIQKRIDFTRDPSLKEIASEAKEASVLSMNNKRKDKMAGIEDTVVTQRAGFIEDKRIPKPILKKTGKKDDNEEESNLSTESINAISATNVDELLEQFT